MVDSRVREEVNMHPFVYIGNKLEERRARREQETPADRAARVTATATAWMAVFTVLLALLNGVTVVILRNQLKEMHEGGVDTHALAQASSNAADAAADQADASQQFSDTAEDINEGIAGAVDQLEAAADNAKASIKATQDALRLDQRAWVGTEDISSVPTTPETDKVWDVNVSMKNSGKTPAKNILMWNTEALLKALPNVNADCAEAIERQASKTMLPPNGGYKALLHVANGVKMPSDWEKEIKDNGAIYVHGCVLYDDVFRRPHWMTYCGVYDIEHKSGFQSCLKYNDTGDGKPPE
jgi:hypothetical protein